MGAALEKLGDYGNAKIAYETASKLKPKPYHRAEKAIANSNIKIQYSRPLMDNTHGAYYEDKVIIVSRLPRSGTSLMMQILHKEGVALLTDNKREADVSYPKGYDEYDPVMSIHKDNSWLELAQNKWVKIVSLLLKFLHPKYRYKIIFMNRDLNEIITSQ